MNQLVPPRLTIGVDIGGSKILAGIVDRNGHVVDFAREGTPSQSGPAAILDVVQDLVAGLRERAPGDVLACGVGSAGTIDVSGCVISATDHLAAWTGTNIVRELERRTHLPVAAINDVHAAALGEAWAGYPGAADRCMLVAVGTGLGAAVVAQGKLLRGANMAAGSLGHTSSGLSFGRRCSCGGLDHLEAYVSGPGMELTYREQTGDSRLVSLTEIGALADAGDSFAVATILEAGDLLGDAIADAICLLDPGIVLLTGGVLGLGDAFAGPVKRRAADRLATPPLTTAIQPSTLGGNAALVGAGLLAQRLLDGIDPAAWFG